jgi:hypothetical protein
MMNEQELTDIWKSYEKLAMKVGHRSEAIKSLFDNLGERLLLCPAEPRNDCPGCEPGGLLKQAIGITRGMKLLNDTFETAAPIESIILVGLFHEIGKVGSLTEPYFLDEDESWRRDKFGSFYKINDKISKLTVSERSLYLLQHFGVHLSEDEFLAIRGPTRQADWAESRLFPSTDPVLTVLLKSSRDLLVRRFGS